MQSRYGKRIKHSLVFIRQEYIYTCFGYTKAAAEICGGGARKKRLFVYSKKYLQRQPENAPKLFVNPKNLQNLFVTTINMTKMKVAGDIYVLLIVLNRIK